MPEPPASPDRPFWSCPACRLSDIVLDDQSPETLTCPRCGGRFARAEVLRPGGSSTTATPVTRVQAPGAGQDEPFVAEPPSPASRYLLEGELGRGGMGVVLLACDTAFDRLLAVKVLRETVAGQAEAERRFLDEARLTAQLQHPGIPPVHDVGRLEDGRPFFAMKLIRGRTLEQLLRERPTPADDRPRFLDVFEQVCQTLAYAHARGVIHRDLKPHNVMVGAFGEVQVMDWGLAKVLAEGRAHTAAAKEEPISPAETLTQAGSVVGTPAFMPPEQARGETDRLDERSDVFGLGGILCVILTGQPPFTASPFRTVLQQAAQGDLSEAGQRLDRCGADPDLVGLAKKCLAADKGERYADAGEVTETVGRYRQGVQERLRQAELERERSQVQAREERRRRRVTLALAGVLLVLLLGVGGVVLWAQQQRSERESRARRLNAGLAQALDAADGERRRLHDRLADPNEVAALLSDLRPWKESLERAWSSWRQARKLAEGEPDLLDPRSRERLDGLEAKLKADDADHETVRAFDALRLDLFEDTRSEAGSAAATRKYLRFFAEKGWDPGTEDRSPTAERLRRSPLRYVATAALDLAAWAAFTSQPADRNLAERCLALARLVDADPWRDRFRQVAVWNDAARLREVATARNVRGQSPQVVMIAADLLNRHKGDAAGLLREAILRRAGDFWLNHTLGLLSPDPQERVAGYRAALAIRPTSGTVYSNLGVALGKGGNLDPAIAHLSRALELNPEHVSARCNLGVALEKKGHFAEAVVPLTRALELDPGNATARHNLAVTLNKLGKKHWSLYLNLLAQEQTDRAYEQLRRAVESFEKAVSLEPGGWDHLAPLAHGYTLQAEIARTLGRTEEAKARYRKSRTLYEKLRRHDPANIFYRKMLAIIDRNLAEMLKTGAKD